MRAVIGVFVVSVGIGLALWPGKVSESLSIYQNRIEQIQMVEWSGQQDLNLRPAVPKTAALPGCAIPRRSRLGDTSFSVFQQPKG
jgi:hypothetical protein